jgi:hypothetical protein
MYQVGRMDSAAATRCTGDFVEHARLDWKEVPRLPGYGMAARKIVYVGDRSEEYAVHIVPAFE